ncbi:Hypothetical predicted protein [Mytilus galloprovincialis]|uniref:Uncharacterized protein n=1 Tax=Mytilus galloprovincialis TaxID=29158 RepID=A0A8B6BP97_MYTGA|nr:Hypothetical predicted protein [Mytilus galloprovincialis]
MSCLMCLVIFGVFTIMLGSPVRQSPCHGCRMEINPLSGNVQCDCPERRINKRSDGIKTHGHHTHTTHVHHHNHTHKPYHHGATYTPLTTFNMNLVINNEPLTTLKQLIQTTKYPCPAACIVMQHPDGWNYCKCPTTAPTPLTTADLSTTIKVTKSTANTIDYTSAISIKDQTSASNNVDTSTERVSPLHSTERVSPLHSTKNVSPLHSTDASTTYAPTTVLLTKGHAITTSLLKLITTSLLTTSTTRAPTIKPTKDICAILCASQQGGDACHCSKPGLPG